MRLSLPENLSARERRLAGAVGFLVLSWMLFILIARPIIAEWQRLESEIETKIGRRDFNKTILQMEESVNAKFNEYRELLTQESTDEVIRNELMQDINTLSAKSWLKAPVIRQGSTESHDYYKRYFVNIDYEGVPASLAVFLRHLQTSKKLFRIESLTITKKGDRWLSGRIEVSRILVPAEGSAKPRRATQAPAQPEPNEGPDRNLLANGDMEGWGLGWGRDKYPDSWSGYWATTARLTAPVVSGFASAKITGAVKGSAFYQDVEADPGTRYKITWHVARDSGQVSLRLFDMESRQFYDEGTVVVEDKSMREYTQTFRTRSNPDGAKITLRVEVLFLKPGSAATIDDVRMVKLGGNETGGKEG